MPHPRLKRLLRISLRTVFVLTTILCIWLGYKVHQVKKQREAVAWVEEHGGFAMYDYQLIFRDRSGAPKPVPNAPPPGPKWLRDLLGLDYFSKPRVVSMFDAEDVADLTPLTDLRGLKCLVVHSTKVRDLSPLSELQEVYFLNLDCPEAHDLTPVMELKQLRVLILPATIPDDEIAQLRQAHPDCDIRVLLTPTFQPD